LEGANHILTAAVRKAVTGDADSKAWLYKTYSKAMFNICIRITSNHNYAEDALQEAFVSAFNNLHQLKQEEQFGGWLKRIVINQSIKLSKQQHQLEVMENIPDTMVVVEDDFWDGVSLEQIHDCIKKLPNGCRQVFTLYAVEDYSHKQIAETMSISESTSKSQYHRAKGILKQQLQTLLHQHG
jgi:RNA polymerase sigma factor (sigma-70 family)